MTNPSNVFANMTNTEFLTYEQVQEKYNECSTQHGLTEAQNGQVTKIYGCKQCKVYFYFSKTDNGWYMKSIQPAQYRLFGFESEVTFNQEDEAKARALEQKISEIQKGQTIEIVDREVIMNLFNFVQKYGKHPRFKNAEITPIRGIIKIRKK